jgi:hypothetical protein
MRFVQAVYILIGSSLSRYTRSSTLLGLCGTYDWKKSRQFIFLNKLMVLYDCKVEYVLLSMISSNGASI